ncbi:hypothetical protein I3843_05G211800 [Carya illinoinensis]|nr:hypothetical protein I3843_05G211800 [Carya illinoinensis]
MDVPFHFLTDKVNPFLSLTHSTLASALSTVFCLVRCIHCMAANSKSRGVALNLGKRVVNQIWTSNPRDPSLPSALTLRRAAHASVYDKNEEDHTPSIVPDNVIPPQSETYWAPHPQTGVFGPPAEQNSAAASESGSPSPTVDGGEGSVLEEKAWFRHSSVEDSEKPHTL